MGKVDASFMCLNKQLLILVEKIFTAQKYIQKVKLKSSKLLFLNILCKKLEPFLVISKENIKRALFVIWRFGNRNDCLATNSNVVNMINVIDTWIFMVLSLSVIIECGNSLKT
jgi:hypothetical protein